VHATWFRKALDAGVRMALGSDIRPLKDAALLEMGLWVRDGATPWQTLVAATRHGAAVCGVGAELGTVEVGKLADLIVVGANPLEDIHECPPPAASPKRGPGSFGQAASEWAGPVTRGSNR
jgi:imidazolonepropionase-like amidohydrolase